MTTQQTLNSKKTAKKPIKSTLFGAILDLCIILFLKCMCNIFKNCRKTFNEKPNKNRSQINGLLTNIL